MNNIISLSGGKDSTAMLLMMLERNEPIHSVVFFDTGWEFPQMHDHIDKLEQYVDMEFVRLKPSKPFTYWMLERQVKKKNGEGCGEVHRIGNGWPSPMRRWCTRQKIEPIKKYENTVDNHIACIGYAADEAKRTAISEKAGRPMRFPLIEYDVSEAEALSYCYKHGFDWGGLYEHFNRVSCFCCPLQRIGDLRILRQHFPEQWAQMLEWDAAIPNNRGFMGYKTVHDFEKRFAEEDRQLTFF